MGTRSQIGRLISNGQVESIYCHYDGYVAGVGDMLITNYSDTSKMFHLIRLGSIRSLNSSIEETKEEMMDEGINIRISVRGSVEGFLERARENGTEYAYLWTGEYFDAWEYDYSAQVWREIDIYEVANAA